ncbi:MAG: hypothetical protein CMH57_12255 [Myxococcales bacterium]|nr:hypothetical protein [Myxococcales bacterium]
MSTLANILERLRCPRTHQRLTLAEPELIERLNAMIAQGELARDDGVALSEPLQGGLLRDDQQALYPIRDGLPVLLPQEAIAVP